MRVRDRPARRHAATGRWTRAGRGTNAGRGRPWRRGVRAGRSAFQAAGPDALTPAERRGGSPISEERRLGEECVSPRSTRWYLWSSKTKTKPYHTHRWHTPRHKKP